MRLYLVRHAAVVVRPETSSRHWHLSPEGRAAAEALAREPYWPSIALVYSSAEVKAIATAQRIAAPHELAIRIERALGEVERPWTNAVYEDLVRRYLAGEPVEGWEPRDAALGRVRSCIDAIVTIGEDAAVVSHGLALTLYVSDLLDLDADASYELWRSIRFPDVAIVDPQARRAEKAFGP
ncbi:MAG: histidine phosphatase family protein [Dehalococcoidia bacterium]